VVITQEQWLSIVTRIYMFLLAVAGLLCSYQSDFVSNVDSNSSRAMIKVFNLTSNPDMGFEWSTGSVFVHGLRNEVGMAIFKMSNQI
jgi:hypothetical protein